MHILHIYMFSMRYDWGVEDGGIICIYIYMYLCVYVYVYMSVYIYTCIYIYTYFHIYICIYTHVYMYIHVYISRTDRCTQTCRYMHRNTYVKVH